MTKYSYKSLEDYLQSHRLDVDGLLDDGWGAPFPVKGRLIDVAILFCDLRSFSDRSKDLSPIETLILANNFFAWISAEGFKDRPCIVDKYIGDEIMVIFSEEFGSNDPVVDAADAARWIVERDALAFCPRIGIDAGEVVIGYVGTPLKYDCSVYGTPVTIAQRCCQVKDAQGSIVIPAKTWGSRKVEDVLTKGKIKTPDGEDFERPFLWSVTQPREVTFKHDSKIEIVELTQRSKLGGVVHLPSQSVEDRARQGFELLKKEGSYHPSRYDFEAIPESLKKIFQKP